jgi:RNA-binding protein
MRPFDELVVRVLGEPAGAALGAFGHYFVRSGLTSFSSPTIMTRMQLSERQKKHLRRLAHPLNPIVMIGNAGLTDGVVNELDRALTDHELVKVSARVGERNARNAALDSLADRTASALVQRVGHVGVFYRRRAEMPKILIPDQ